MNHSYNLVIVERHLDTFGHVNNATYLEILEEARWDWITKGGYGLDKVKELQQGPTILECSLSFRRELTNRERIVVSSELCDYTGKVGKVVQRIHNAKEELCCEAHFLIALFDMRARKLIVPSAPWLSCLGLSVDAWRPKRT